MPICSLNMPIPDWSLLTCKKGVDQMGVDETGVDQLGVDEMGVDQMGRHHS